MSLAPTVSSTSRACGRRDACARVPAPPAAARSGAGTVPAQRSPSARAFARALRVEQAGVDGGAGAGERQEGHRDLRVLDRERERGAQSDSRRASGGRPPTSSARRGAPIRVGGAGPGSARAVVAGLVAADSRRGSDGNIRSPRRRGSGGSRSRRRRARPARSGLPSPAATESPMPAIRRSRTRISAVTLSTLLSGRVMPTAAMVGRAVAHAQPAPPRCRRR